MGEEIEREVLSWPGVHPGVHVFAGRDFLLGEREIGHLHGEGWIDVPFPRDVRDELVNSGEAEPHHWLRGSGWVSLHLREPADTGRAIALLRRSYELALNA